MIEVQEIFDVSYGTNLELNKLEISEGGINFVSRTAKNNGVSAKVKKLKHVMPLKAGTITVAGGGSVLETFLQVSPFYSGRDLYCLTTKISLNDAEKLFYCTCIKANRYRYNYGRQANKTLKTLLIPSPDEIPKWVKNANIRDFDELLRPVIKKVISLPSADKWKSFRYDELFDIERGQGPRKQDLDGTGNTPFITSTDSNNGYTDFTDMSPTHSGNVISVNRNGSVAEAFYQERAFCSTEDVHIFNPKFKLNKYIGMFLSALIKQEKYRYSYGRKWGIKRMNESIIKLPVDASGNPDWRFMENYIKSLPYSKNLEPSEKEVSDNDVNPNHLEDFNSVLKRAVISP